MKVATAEFKRKAHANLHDPQLQHALTRLQERFVGARATALADIDNYAELRAVATEIRRHTLEHLDAYLLHFEQQVTAGGGQVHWAQDAAEVNRLLLDIAQRHAVRKVAKSKSMVTEECAVNEALGQAGIEVIETDLGEYILQLAGEPPSHIVAPVVHKNKEEVADLFAHHHRRPRQTGIAELCREAREVLRPHFLSADMGLSGANFLVAETGSALIVTNEGNGRLVTTLPRVHVVVTGIEKVVPTLEDVSVLLRLLPRSATGQAITNYVSVLTGPRRAGDADGPEHFYVILVDNGRSRLLGSELEPMLRCIRCGACMNHCPVYQNIGGHAYGWVYPGPMGSVLTPNFVGLGEARDLPNASTFCGACAEVCPVGIPLPDLLRSLRVRQVEQGLRPRTERILLRLWSWFAQRPALYALTTRIGARVLRALANERGMITRLPPNSGWTGGRDFPAPEGRTFRELYARRAKP
jgi:L-lactate dehydrogenase complex protein LldF